VKGKIQSVKRDSTSPNRGTFELKLTLNAKTVKVPMKFAIDAGTFTADGTLDVMDFGLSNAFASLHKACEALHTGADGVSKTWTPVDLKITSKMGMICK
jgi:hypothetical protein